MELTYEEYFKNLRLTTMQVATPMVALSVGRMQMINVMLEYIQTLPVSKEQQAVLKQFNQFIAKDKELVELTKGNIDSALSPS